MANAQAFTMIMQKFLRYMIIKSLNGIYPERD